MYVFKHISGLLAFVWGRDWWKRGKMSNVRRQNGVSAGDVVAGHFVVLQLVNSRESRVLKVTGLSALKFSLVFIFQTVFLKTKISYFLGRLYSWVLFTNWRFARFSYFSVTI